MEAVKKFSDTGDLISLDRLGWGVNKNGERKFGCVRDIQNNKVLLGHELIGFTWFDEFYEHYPEQFLTYIPYKPKKILKPQTNLFE